MGVKKSDMIFGILSLVSAITMMVFAFIGIFNQDSPELYYLLASLFLTISVFSRMLQYLFSNNEMQRKRVIKFAILGTLFLVITIVNTVKYFS